MSRMARDGTAEPSRKAKFLRRERGREIFIFPVQLTTSRIGNPTQLIHNLAMCDHECLKLQLHLLWLLSPVKVGKMGQVLKTRKRE